jgi:hypothetical protein
MNPNLIFLAHAIERTFKTENLLFDLFKSCEGDSVQMDRIVSIARSSWETEGKSDPDLAAVFLKAQLPRRLPEPENPESRPG